MIAKQRPNFGDALARLALTDVKTDQVKERNYCETKLPTQKNVRALFRPNFLLCNVTFKYTNFLEEVTFFREIPCKIKERDRLVTSELLIFKSPTRFISTVQSLDRSALSTNTTQDVVPCPRLLSTVP